MYKIFLPARHGAGDNLNYFLDVNYNKFNPQSRILARAMNAYKQGLVEQPLVIYEEHYGNAWSLWEGIGFIVKRTYCFNDVPDYANDNWMPERLSSGHINVFSCQPDWFLEIDPNPLVEVPQRKPPFDIPDNFILFTDGAGGNDRRLTDKNIIDNLQKILPVVRVGTQSTMGMGCCSNTNAVCDLVDKLSLPEVFYLASKCKFIVSAISYLRTCSSFFNKFVFELIGNSSNQTLNRTRWEYESGNYGINSKNYLIENLKDLNIIIAKNGLHQ